MQISFPTGSLFRGKRLVILLTVLFIIIGFLLLLTIRGVRELHLPTGVVMQNYNQIHNPLDHGAAPRKPPQPGIGPVVGKASAPITVIEFTDYECPLCVEYFENAYQEIRRKYILPGLVKYEIRHFPLSTTHPHAELAAEAALCAEKQNAFEKMHDFLFANTSEWSGSSDPAVFFRSYAASSGINVALFSTCLSSREMRTAVDRDKADAANAGINGAPVFWVNAPDGSVRLINGAYPFTRYQTVFDTFLSDSR